MVWRIPRVFEGRTVAVLASGPSMSQRVADLVHVAGVPAIAINSTYRLAPWAWMLYAADTDWWVHPDNAKALQFPGLRVSCQPIKGVHMLRNAGPEGFSDDPGEVHTLGNSGGQAMQVAIKAGAARVLLCGFDMHASVGSHWHGDHPQGLRNTVPGTYEVWIRRMANIAPLIAARGVDVVNCTPGSALTGYRKAKLEDELGPAARDVLA